VVLSWRTPRHSVCFWSTKKRRTYFCLDVGLLLLLLRRRCRGLRVVLLLLFTVVAAKAGSDNTNDENTDSTDDDDDENKEDNDEDERKNRNYQNDKNDSNDIENEHSCFDLETFVKDVAERLHVDDDSIDSETEYKDGNSKGTSSGVSSLDVSHEQQ